MRYEVLFEKNNYALIVRKNELDEYAVVYGLNKETGSWAHTVAYANFGEYSSLSQAEALTYALDVFLVKTEDEYISRSRLEELATKFKDKLIEDDKEEAMEYFDNECYMEDYEKEFFGIKEEDDSEEKDDYDSDFDFYTDDFDLDNELYDLFL